MWQLLSGDYLKLTGQRLKKKYSKQAVLLGQLKDSELPWLCCFPMAFKHHFISFLSIQDSSPAGDFLSLLSGCGKRKS